MTQDSSKPLIGIVASGNDYAERYADAVRRSDGEPSIILPSDYETLQDVISRICGLVLCGASDVDNETVSEVALLAAALDANMPVLCLSEGMHMLNTVAGGKRARETPSHSTQTQACLERSRKDGEGESSYHHIFITPGSKLAAVVGSGGFVRVNSRHSTGLREAQKSPELLASAYSVDDGVIEALESPAHRWVIGVQFNPERFNELPPHFLRLFQSMIDRAKEWQNGGENS